MYCTQCGTQNPDDVRFCSSCGKKVGTSANPQSADDVLNRLTSEQQEQLFHGMVETVLAPMQEGIDVLVEHAKAGLVTTHDILTAKEILANYKGISGDMPTPENNVLFVYQDAFSIYETYRQHWGKITKENRDRLAEELPTFAHGGLQGLFAHTSIIEQATQSRILAYLGIVQYLEEVLVSDLLLQMKFTGVELSTQGREMLIKSKGEKFVEKVLLNMQGAFNHYVAEVQSKK